MSYQAYQATIRPSKQLPEKLWNRLPAPKPNPEMDKLGPGWRTWERYEKQLDRDSNLTAAQGVFNFQDFPNNPIVPNTQRSYTSMCYDYPRK